MRHRKSGIKLNRTSSHRHAMFRNMVTSLFKYDSIKTTDAKAKELRKWADHMITLAKRGDLHARRQALSIIREKDVVHKLFEAAADRFGSVSGGYTRIIKLGRRPGDAAPVSLIELISLDGKKSKSKKKKVKPAPEKVVEKKEETGQTPTAKESSADKKEDEIAVSEEKDADSENAVETGAEEEAEKAIDASPDVAAEAESAESEEATAEKEEKPKED